MKSNPLVFVRFSISIFQYLCPALVVVKSALGVIMPSPSGRQICSRCSFSECGIETINHLFLHCRETAKLWLIFINLRGISWTMPRSIKEALACWNRDRIQSGHWERWKIVPAYIWWTIWMERNQRCFENKSSSLQTLKMNCLVLFVFWCKHKYPQEKRIFLVFRLYMN